jgi:hypothetical protein
MITHESGYKADKPPVEEMWDVLIHSRSAIDDPSEAYYFAGLQGMEIAGDFVDDKRPVTAQSLGDLRHWVALENQLGASLVAQGKVNPRELDRRSDYFGNVQTKLTEKGTDVDILGTVQSAQELTREETWEHFLGELSDYRASLAGEKAIPVDEETGEPVKLKDAGHYVNVAEALWVGAWNDTNADPMQKVQRGEKLEQEVEKMTSLLLGANKVGLAINFAKIILDPSVSEPLTDKIVAKLREVREVEGEDSYRHVYNYATRTLNKGQKTRFLQQQPKETTPLIFGSQHEVLHADTDPILSERFEEGNLVWTTLSDGSRIPMPYLDYRNRTILGYGSVSESEIYESQSGVDYNDLPDDAKQAIETAIQVADQDLLKTETLPHYKRLAFWRDEEKGDLLYTVIFRDGAGRIMTRYPDHHGFVTSDKERKLDYPVKSAVPVKDTYMVMPYSGSYMWDETFRDTEPNFFGPGEDKANAFWIMGNARTVFSKTDERLTRDSHGMPTSRFVIVPVRFYQVEEDREASDPTTGDEEKEFFANLTNQ